MVEKWAQKVDIDEGSLTRLGWPSAKKLARSIREGRATYKQVIQKLVFIHNVSGRKNPKLKMRAAAVMAKLRHQFGESD